MGNVDSEQLLNSDNNVLAFASPQIEIETPDAKPDDVKSKTSEISTAFKSYQRLNHIAFDDYNPEDRVHLDDKNQFEECVPLDKCESLDWLVQNINTSSASSIFGSMNGSLYASPALGEPIINPNHNS